MNEKYISKIDSGGTHCYFVRVPKFEHGVALPLREYPLSKTFSKGTDTWKAALIKAVEWRDNYLKEHHATYCLNKRRRIMGPALNFKNNSSGVIGVHRGHCYKPSGKYAHWKGSYSTHCDKNRQYHKSYSVGLYGEEQAFRLACIHRFKHAGVLIVTDRSKLPCAPPVDYYIKKTGRLYKACPPELSDVYQMIIDKYSFNKKLT